MKRSLFLAIACAALTGVGARNASADFVPLPSNLGAFVNSNGSTNGNFTTVAAPNETDTFSAFNYTTSPAGTPPLAGDVNMKAYNAGPEAGITFSANFVAGPGTTVDYEIQYVITAGPGGSISDATLSMISNVTPGGSVSIGETFTDLATGMVVGSLSTFDTTGATKLSDSTTFGPGITSILVQKDIQIFAGANGASGVSIINQGFSSTAVPEPASMALLGIGMTGFLAFRRFFKKTSVA